MSYKTVKRSIVADIILQISKDCVISGSPFYWLLNMERLQSYVWLSESFEEFHEDVNHQNESDCILGI